MQDYLVDIWTAENLAWQNNKKVQKAINDELCDIQAVLHGHQDEHQEEGDIFDHIDINGQDVAIEPATAVVPDLKADNETTDKYINNSFPHYHTYDEWGASDVKVILGEEWTQGEYPVLKYTTNKIRTKLLTHEWEPIAWAVNLLQ